MINLLANKRLSKIRDLVSGSLAVMLIMIGAEVCAQDNPVPSSWGTLTVSTVETYGNNQTKKLHTAKVTIEYADPEKAAAYFRQHNVNVRMPASRNSGGRGAVFTRVPPSNLVGPYKITVDPKKQGCAPKEKEFRMGSAKKNMSFNFQCNKASASNTSRNTVSEELVCHRVLIKSQGSSQRKLGSTYAEACPNENGEWVIQPYSYK